MRLGLVHVFIQVLIQYVLSYMVVERIVKCKDKYDITKWSKIARGVFLKWT